MCHSWYHLIDRSIAHMMFGKVVLVKYKTVEKSKKTILKHKPPRSPYFSSIKATCLDLKTHQQNKQTNKHNTK